MSKIRDKHRNAKRKHIVKRRFLHQEQKDGFTRRWVKLGHEGNYEYCLELGYQVVHDNSKGSNPKQTDSLATAQTVVGDFRTGEKHVLMEIPTDIYDEIQELKQEEVDDIEEAYTLGQSDLASFKRVRKD